jgi:spermidine/putrescine-binding protein
VLPPASEDIVSKGDGDGRFSKAGGASVVGAILALVLSLSTPGAQGQAKQFEGVTLRVATFGGPWRDDLAKNLSPKIEALGGKVEFVIGSPQDNLAKLIAARGREAPFDVIEILERKSTRSSKAGC